MEMLFLFVHIGVREVIPRGNDFSVDPWGGGWGGNLPISVSFVSGQPSHEDPH